MNNCNIEESKTRTSHESLSRAQGAELWSTNRRGGGMELQPYDSHATFDFDKRNLKRKMLENTLN